MYHVEPGVSDSHQNKDAEAILELLLKSGADVTAQDHKVLNCTRAVHHSCNHNISESHAKTLQPTKHHYAPLLAPHLFCALGTGVQAGAVLGYMVLDQFKAVCLRC